MVAFLVQEAGQAAATASITGSAVLVGSLLVTIAWVWHLYS